MTTVYKIVAADLWQATEDSGVFTGAGAFSTAAFFVVPAAGFLIGAFATGFSPLAGQWRIA